VDTEASSNQAGVWRQNGGRNLLLGIVLILASLFALQNAVAATVVKTVLVGMALLTAGLFELVHAIWVGDRSSFLWRLLVGALHTMAGLLLVLDPVTTSVIVSLAFAAALVGAGLIRVVLAIQSSQPFRWLLFASGIVGILAGVVILAKWPFSGLWVFGIVVGADLLLQGIWWTVVGWIDRGSKRPV
jgi:uncharacterized membrane protein HdeD (DUF308 family)